MPYLQLPLDVDFHTLLARAVARIQAKRPGYRFDTASLDAAILEELTRVQQETRQTTVVVSDALFDWDSENFYGRARHAATAAAIDVTITVADDTGHAIPAGSLAAFDVGDGQLLAFTLLQDLTIPNGATTGDTTFLAVLTGARGNNLGPGPMRLVQMPAAVAQVTATGTSTGGADLEGDDAYRSRMAELRLITTDKPVGAADFAIIAKQWPGIARAIAIDNYDAANDLADQEGHITTVTVAEDGSDVDPQTLLELAAWFASPDNRHVGVVPHVINPDRQPITVDFSAVAHREADPTGTTATAIAAVAAYLSPARHGTTADDASAWQRIDTIRYLEVAAVLDRVPGLDYVTGLTLDGGTADVPLVGIAVLPQATITGSVAAP